MQHGLVLCRVVEKMAPGLLLFINNKLVAEGRVLQVSGSELKGNKVY